MRSLSLVLACFALLAPVRARGSIVVPLSLAELVEKAESIAVARVESQVARWTSDHGAIYTDVTLRVLQSMKGTPRAGETITVRREGGSLDGVGMKVFGAASFATGEDVLLFTERRGEARYTVGMAQGRMAITAVDGRRMVSRQTSGMAFLPATRRDAPAATERAVRPLDEVLREVAALVGRSR